MGRLATALRLASVVWMLIVPVGSASAGERVLRLLSPGQPETLDPHMRHWLGERMIDSILLEGLTREDADGNPAPGAAASWEVSADGLNYTFHLRKEASFSDGRPVTAADFIYAFRRLVDPKTAAGETSIIEPVAHARECLGGKLPPEALGARAVDPLTLELTLEQPNPFFLASAAQLVPLEREVVERWGRAWTSPEHMVSNGPFMLSDFTPNGSVGLSRNPLYWNAARINLDRITFVDVENSRTAQRMFAAGEIDAIDLTADDFKDGGPLPGAELRTQPVNRIHFLFFNMHGGGPLAESKPLRRALALALDQDTLERKIMRSVSEPAYAMVPDNFPNYSHPREDFAGRSMTDRVDEARRLYAEAGYGPDRPLAVKVVLADRKSCAALQEMWRIALGARVACDVLEGDRGLKEAYRSGQFDIGMTGDNTEAFDPLMILGDFRSPPLGTINDGRYSSPAYDALIRQAQRAADAAVRASKLADAERVLLDDQAMIPLSFTRSAYAVSSRVHGYRALPSRTLFIDDVTVEP